MVCADFFLTARNPSQQRPLPPLPHEDKVDETYGAGSTRVLKKQGPAKAVAAATRGTISVVSSPFFCFVRRIGH